MQMQDNVLSKEELDNSVEECSCEGGPLSSILSLIRVVFLSQAPNYSQERYRRTISENQSLLQDSILLSSCIVRTFAHMAENHPDFLYFFLFFKIILRKAKELIILFSRSHEDIALNIVKVILCLKTDKSNNYLYFIAILEYILTHYSSYFFTNPSKLVDSPFGYSQHRIAYLDIFLIACIRSTFMSL